MEDEYDGDGVLIAALVLGVVALGCWFCFGWMLLS